MNPLLCLNAPDDDTQNVLTCNPSVPLDSSMNQTKQKILLDKDNDTYSFKPLNNAFSSGCSSSNHSPYPSNNIVISIDGNNALYNHESSSGHALSSHFQKHLSLTQQV